VDSLTGRSSVEPRADRSQVRNVYRTRSQAIAIGCVLLLDIVLGVEGAVRAHSRSTTGFVLGGLLLLLIAIPVARGALAVLIVTDQGVTVRNPFRTVSIGWDEVAAFELGRYKVLGCVCLVRRVDRTVVPAFAIQGITGQARRRTSVLAKQTVGELNEQLGRTGGTGVASPQTGASQI
jgi:hypothetical protein